VHLDLSNTMLQEATVMSIATFMLKSLTIMSVHLSGNEVSQ
jgi:hypothetical protein